MYASVPIYMFSEPVDATQLQSVMKEDNSYVTWVRGLFIAMIDWLEKHRIGKEKIAGPVVSPSLAPSSPPPAVKNEKSSPPKKKAKSK